MADDSRDTGIPTRAIHEGYLQMQQAHRQFRTARDDPDLDETPAHGDFQDAVLSFYELVRPHLKHETGLSDYWQGSLPDYTGWDFDSEREALQYIRDKSTGVYQLQQHTDVVSLEQQTLTDGGLSTFEEWHTLLGLSKDTERLIAVQPTDSQQYFVKLVRAAVLPLQELDHWQVHIRSERSAGQGFMAGETRTERHREFEPAQKVVAAKRLLVEAADTLSLLSDVEASAQRTEITREDIQKVEQWHQERTNQ